MYSSGALVLLLISAGIDGATRKSHSHSHEHETSAAAGQAFEQLLQTSNSKSDLGSQSVQLGAEGFAQVGLSVDMRAFLQNLNMIPNLQQTLLLLSKRVEEMSHRPSECSKIEGKLPTLQTVLINRIDRNEAKSEAIINGIQQIQRQLKTILDKVNHLVDEGERNAQRGFAGGTSCENAHQEVMANLEKILSSLPQVVHMFEKAMNKAIEPLVSPVANTHQNSKKLLSYHMKLEDFLQPGRLTCAVSSKESGHTAKILQGISSIEETIGRMPLKIVHTLGPQIGSVKDILPSLKDISSTGQKLKGDISGLKVWLNKNNQEIKRWFYQNQKSLVAVKKIVTETTEVVQNSAAAAMSASRSLKCGNKNNDLE